MTGLLLAVAAVCCLHPARTAILAIRHREPDCSLRGEICLLILAAAALAYAVTWALMRGF